LMMVPGPPGGGRATLYTTGVGYLIDPTRINASWAIGQIHVDLAYEVCLGTMPYSCDAFEFASVAHTPGEHGERRWFADSLDLPCGATYFATVRATNCAGLSRAVASEGLKLCCSAPSGGTVAAPAWQGEPRFVPMTTRQNPNRPRKVAPYDPTLSAVQEKSISDAEDDACANAADAIPVARPVGVERAADFGNYHWVEDPEEARNHIQGVWQDLFSTWETSIMAVDVGYHLGMVYHVQLATQERTIVLNAWKLKDSMHELLQPLLEAPWVSKIFHGASKHIFLLNFSYDIMVKGQIFDLAAPSELPQLITLKDTIQKSRSWEQKWWQDPC